MDDRILSLRPDRGSVQRHLDSYIRQAHRREQLLALLVIQIQRGQELNTLFGSHSVETLLQETAERLAGLGRPVDRILRLGDLEYAMILPEVMNEGHAMLAANRAAGAFSMPFMLGRRPVPVEVCIGIALFPDHAGKPESLVQCAESALEECRTKRLPYQIFTDSAFGRIADAWDIEKEIEIALHNGEFEVSYQPQIDLRTHTLCGAEALLRWNSPRRGYVQPDDFIPVATRTGRISELTWSTLNMALQNAAAWPRRDAALNVAVNLSPTILTDDTLVHRVMDALALWGLPPERLTLEITESAIMSHAAISFDNLRHLRAKNVRISIDDFGTGYSTLANFRDIPATELKIDKSFVLRMLEDESEAKIVRAIIGLGKNFELSLAAEGAENPLTLSTLAYLGCDTAQGYCISKPLAAEAFTAFVKGFKPLEY